MAVEGINGKQGPIRIEPDKTRSKPSNPSKPAADVQSQDKISFSETKQEFMRIRQLVDSVQDLRWDRVEQLTRTVDQGAYKVSASELADKIVEKNWIDLTA